MHATTSRLLAIALCAASAASPHLLPACYAMPFGEQTQPAAGPGAATRRIGAIKAIKPIDDRAVIQRKGN